MPNFDPLTYRYSSRRNVVYAKNGVCCTSVPLGAQVGLDVLKNGGNAVDAAVAMAGAMPLLEPTGNGLGSDCFALVWIEKEKKLYGLNASGVAPMALSADEVRAKGFSEVPEEGWLPTMVPGAPAGWGRAQCALWHKAALRTLRPRHFLRRKRLCRARQCRQALGARQQAHRQGHGAGPRPL